MPANICSRSVYGVLPVRAEEMKKVSARLFEKRAGPSGKAPVILRREHIASHKNFPFVYVAMCTQMLPFPFHLIRLVRLTPHSAARRLLAAFRPQGEALCSLQISKPSPRGEGGRRSRSDEVSAAAGQQSRRLSHVIFASTVCTLQLPLRSCRKQAGAARNGNLSELAGAAPRNSAKRNCPSEYISRQKDAKVHPGDPWRKKRFAFLPAESNDR